MLIELRAPTDEIQSFNELQRFDLMKVNLE